jgi:predicted ATP-grasp superfamily ATP-dependent carboligase
LKVLVYEYASGGGYACQTIPSSVFAEGYAMLRCVAADLEAAGHLVTVLLDERISKFNVPLDVSGIVIVSSTHDFQEVISSNLVANDAVLIIAPETGQILQKLIKAVEQTGKIVLNCTSDAIAVVSGKAQLTDYLQKNGYSTPKTLVLTTDNKADDLKKTITNQLAFPLVFKPIDGTSCTAISLVKTDEEIAAAVQKIKNQSANPQFVVQEYVNGLAASISVVSNGKKAVALSLNNQQIALASAEKESFYAGGCVPLEHPLKARALSVAEHLVEAFPGLRGYVGVDVILADDGVYIVDVNPRLTTSFVGLHAACDFNVAQALVEAITEGKLPQKCVYSTVAFFSKYETNLPKAEQFQKTLHQDTVVTPPFPLEGNNNATALVIGRGANLQDACLRLEEAKKNLHSILG